MVRAINFASFRLVSGKQGFLGPPQRYAGMAGPRPPCREVTARHLSGVSWCPVLFRDTLIR